MRLLTITMLTAVLALSAGACGKKDKTAGASGSSEAGEAGDSAAFALESQSFEFPIQRDADQRKLTFNITAQIPKGWAADPQAKQGKKMTTLMPPGRTGLFSSNVTLSSTCHGMCSADKYIEQIKAAPAQQLKFAGKGATTVKDEEIRPGVWGFMFEKKTSKGKAVTIGVSHYQEGWPQIVFCNAHLESGNEAHAAAVYKACAELKVVVNDPLMPQAVLDAETVNLGNCPASSSVTFTPKRPQEGDPTAFGETLGSAAYTSRPGYVVVALGNYPLKNGNLSKNGPGDGQMAVRFELFHNKDGEVLSGTYPLARDKDTRVSPQIYLPGGTSRSFSSKATATFEVVARTVDKICGTFEIDDAWRNIKGTFVSDVSVGYPRK